MMKKIIYSLFIALLAAVSCQLEEQFEGGAVSQDILTVASNVEIYSVEGGDDLIALTLKSEAKEWSLDQLSGSEWCKVSCIGGRTSTTIKVDVEPNEGAPRQAELHFTALGCKDTVLVINQMGLVKKAMPVDKLYNYGINYNYEDNSVTLALYDIDTDGDCHDYCYLLGDFNGWAPSAQYAMYRDEAKKCWWYTLEDVVPEEEYMYQYCLGVIGEPSVRVCDPYTEIAYTKWDRTNLGKIYPDLPNYPTETTGNVGAFQMVKPASASYDWIHTWQDKPGDTGFKVEDKDDLVIYELWLRNFTEEGTLRAAQAKLPYLRDLGINAIELMPVQEFSSSGWGYDPNLYFALDKDYGTRRDYKAFIDACHAEGIAVFFDVVYNHLTDDSPLVKMYYRHCRTAINNPWFNQVPKHPHNVNRDINHGDEFIRLHVKQSLKYLLEEYKIDGFRFDLTKGLTQKDSGEDDGECSQYDPFRISLLKEYYDAIQAVNPHAVMICEHFCWDDEQRELGNHGIKVWRQVNSPYCQAAMGHQSDSDFSGLHTSSAGMPFGSYVSFMESHDEERMCYKQTKWGNGAAKTDLEVRMRRAGLCAAFSLLVPGPKMIWQFGELGYDYSINMNEKGEFHETEADGYRTSMKPLKWDYYDDGVPGSGEDEVRRELYNTYAKLLAFRKKNHTFYDDGADFRWYVSADNWPGRYMFIKTKDGSMNMALFGNFGSGSQDISVELPHGGTWYNAFTGDTWNGSNHTPNMEEGKFYLLVDNADAVLDWNPGSEPAPEPDPDQPGVPEPVLSGWYLPGGYNGWNTNDTPLYDMGGEYYVAEDVMLMSGSDKGFKFHHSEYGWKGGSGMVAAGEWYPFGNNNITLDADVAYDVYMTKDGMRFCVVEAGSQVPAYVAPVVKTIYLDAGVWESDDAWFEVWHWTSGSDGNSWVKMMKLSGSVYEVTIPELSDNIIFHRRGPEMTSGWTIGEHFWNTSGDQHIPDGNNCFTITGWGDGGTSTGSWSIR